MNKFKVFSAVVLILSVGMCIFSACKKEEPSPATTTAAEQTSTTKNNGYTYNENLLITEETLTQYSHVVPPVPTRRPKETNNATEKSTEQIAETTKKASGGSVNEESNGLNILSITNPVIKGNNASVIIMGTPDAEYTIEFYETADKKAAYSGLSNTKADSSGIANWTFKIENSCESGDRKVIIREKNSDKYIQTSITVL